VTQAPVAVAARPRAYVADIVITSVLLLFAIIALIVFAIAGLIVDFLGADSPGDTEDAASLAVGDFVSGAVLAVVGIVAGIIFMVRRRRAWWIGATTLVVILVGAFITLWHWTAVIG
jgi:hypothetical protein